MIYTYQQAEEFLNQFITPLQPVSNPETFLDRFKIFLKMLGNPHTTFPSVIVSGTSGKGSTSFILASLLSNAGYKTGYTQSPHLEKLTERIQVSRQQATGNRQKYHLSLRGMNKTNDEAISAGLPRFARNDKWNSLSVIPDDIFVDLLNEVMPIIDAMRSTEYGVPSYYEILLAMAFLYFAKERVDVAIVEVGLEGKYDGTNVLDPLGFVLTNISLDHTNLLGDTIEKIAEEATYKIQDLRFKIQDQKPFVVSGVTQESVVQLIQERAKESGSKLSLLYKDFDFKITKSSVAGVEFDFICHSGAPAIESLYDKRSYQGLQPFQDDIKNVHLSLIGEYQAENAALALETVVQMQKFGVKVSEDVIRQTFKHLFFPGRFEIVRLSKNIVIPTVVEGSHTKQLINADERDSSTALRFAQNDNIIILDGAHNSAKMHAFLASLEKLFPNRKKVFVVAFSKGHDVDDMLSQIVDVADTMIITQYGVVTDMGKQRSVDISRFRIKDLRFKKKVFFEKTINEALHRVQQLVKKKPIGQQELSQEPLLVVTGSLYLVGEVRQWLHRSHS